jgi:hypothetical protein
MRSSLALAAFAATLSVVQAGLGKNGTQNIAVYWGKVSCYEEYSRYLTNELPGQNSINQANTPTAQKRLGYYCESTCFSYHITTKHTKLTTSRWR